MSDKNVYVLYHANCMDGYAAAWAAWKVFSGSAQYFPVHHQESLPLFPEGAVVYILDFCYPIDVLVAAAKRARKVVVLDHHISAQKDFDASSVHTNIPDNLEVHFVQSHSACVIAWNYFHAGIAAPMLLRHIEDHDLWSRNLNNSEAICKALYLRLPVSFSAFEKMNLHILLQEGLVLQKQQKFNVSRLLKSSHLITLAGVDGLAVNAPPVFASDLGHELAKISGTFGLTYHYQGKRMCYECGLRSIGDFDVSLLAIAFNGGGHKNAAGFSIGRETFTGLLER